MPALARVLDDLAVGTIGMRSRARREMPSPFAASLQFGFVMDWMYADDAPRAEQRAALLSLDRALLDELMGGEGADDVDARDARGDAGASARNRAGIARAHGRRARDPPRPRRRSLARRAARAQSRRSSGGSTRRSARASCSSAGARSHRGPTCRRRGRASSSPRLRALCAAFGADASRRVTASALEPRAVATSSRRAAPHGVTTLAARRELLVRFVSLGGAVSIDDVLARYDFDRATGSRNDSTNGRAPESSCAERSAATRRRPLVLAPIARAARDAASSRRRASRSKPSTSNDSRDSCSALAACRPIARGSTATTARRASLGRCTGSRAPPSSGSASYFPARVDDVRRRAFSLDSSPPGSWCGSAAVAPKPERRRSTCRPFASSVAEPRAPGSPRADDPPLGEHAQRDARRAAARTARRSSMSFWP